MNQKQKNDQRSPNCECGGELEIIGAFPTSHVEHCTECHACRLEVQTEEIKASIPLALFFHTRIDAKNESSLDQIMRAPQELFHSLILDVWPNDLIGTLYGIESERHLGTLQYLVRSGVTAVELDRVMGDGEAITALANALPHNPYGKGVEFKTPFDGLIINANRRQSISQGPSLDFDD